MTEGGTPDWPPPGPGEGATPNWPPPGQHAWPPPGTDAGPPPAHGPENPEPPAPRRGPRRFDQRNLLWLIGIVAVGALLVRAHKISAFDLWLFAIVIYSIILHEISHGWVALAFGDDTAKRAGRLSLNPIVHVDPIGTLLLPALLVLSHGPVFGWAKPVPVNVAKLRSPRNQTVWVSLAGPATNLVLAAIVYVILRKTAGVAVGTTGGQTAVAFKDLFAKVLFYAGFANLWLACFNLIPIPPLDGSVLVERVLPRQWWPAYLRIRPYTFPILMVLVLANFYLNPGPLTWLATHVVTGWAHLVG